MSLLEKVRKISKKEISNVQKQRLIFVNNGNMFYIFENTDYKPSEHLKINVRNKGVFRKNIVLEPPEGYTNGYQIGPYNKRRHSKLEYLTNTVTFINENPNNEDLVKEKMESIVRISTTYNDRGALYTGIDYPSEDLNFSIFWKKINSINDPVLMTDIDKNTVGLYYCNSNKVLRNLGGFRRVKQSFQDNRTGNIVNGNCMIREVSTSKTVMEFFWSMCEENAIEYKLTNPNDNSFDSEFRKACTLFRKYFGYKSNPMDECDINKISLKEPHELKSESDDEPDDESEGDDESEEESDNEDDDEDDDESEDESFDEESEEEFE
jgi:hypothetical protein